MVLAIARLRGSQATARLCVSARSQRTQLPQRGVAQVPHSATFRCLTYAGSSGDRRCPSPSD